MFSWHIAPLATADVFTDDGDGSCGIDDVVPFVFGFIKNLAYME